MEKAGFIQKGQQVSVRDIDEMLRQYVEPIEVEVFHYTRKWLQRMTAVEMDQVGGTDQDGAADGLTAQAGDPDAGDHVGGRDPLPAGCPCADQGACRRNWFPVSPKRRLKPASCLCTPTRIRPATQCRARQSALARTSARTLRARSSLARRSRRPRPPGFGPFQRRGKALAPDRTARTQRLGALQINWGLGEPQVGISGMTWQRRPRAV